MSQCATLSCNVLCYATLNYIVQQSPSLCHAVLLCATLDCTVLHSIALCYCVLHAPDCVALSCIVLHSTATMNCTVLHLSILLQSMPLLHCFWYCTVLCCVALYNIVLHFATLGCIVLPCAAVCCPVLQCVALCYFALCCTILCCTVLNYVAMCHILPCCALPRVLPVLADRFSGCSAQLWSFPDVLWLSPQETSLSFTFPPLFVRLVFLPRSPLWTLKHFNKKLGSWLVVLPAGNYAKVRYMEEDTITAALPHFFSVWYEKTQEN